MTGMGTACAISAMAVQSAAVRPGAARPAMDDERVGAGVHDGLRLLEVIARLVVPSKANLCGDRDGHGRFDGRHETALPCRLATQRGPGLYCVK
jgi:hypothetical protein